MAHVQLQNPPLRTVACELRFPPVLAFDELTRNVQNAVKPEFPLTELQQGIELRVGPNVGPEAQLAQQRIVFLRPDRNEQVAVTQSMLILETQAYQSAEHFIGSWRWVVDAVAGQLGIEWQLRLGLRYVNQIDLGGEMDLRAARNRVRPELLAPLDENEPRRASIFRAAHEIRAHQSDGVCTIRYGLNETPEGSHFVIDLDYYNEDQRPFVLDSQIEQLTRFNDGVWELFRWAITDEQFAAFDPVEAS